MKRARAADEPQDIRAGRRLAGDAAVHDLREQLRAAARADDDGGPHLPAVAVQERLGKRTDDDGELWPTLPQSR